MRGAGCHVHVRHRANPNGGLAKSRFPRTVPTSQAVQSAYVDCRFERTEILGDGDCDMVFVAGATPARDSEDGSRSACRAAKIGRPPADSPITGAASVCL